MTREELRAVFLSAADRAWEGSYAGHPLVYVAACDTAGHDNGDEITWHDGRPAIVINHGAVLLPEITPKRRTPCRNDNVLGARDSGRG